MSHFDTPHTVSVIGLGETGHLWLDHTFDLSIGVQDCAKFGKDPDYLVLIDSKNGFKNEPERLEIIKRTRAKKVFTNGATWKNEFPHYEQLAMQSFGKHLKKGRVYCSKSSPFVAASLAYNMGAKNIVLFGVDLVTHPGLKTGSKLLEYDLRNWEKFTRMMAEQGTQCYVSSDYSVLSKFLPAWKPPVPLYINGGTVDEKIILLDQNISVTTNR